MIPFLPWLYYTDCGKQIAVNCNNQYHNSRVGSKPQTHSNPKSFGVLTYLAQAHFPLAKMADPFVRDLGM
jgi:hypothetical protein